MDSHPDLERDLLVRVAVMRHLLAVEIRAKGSPISTREPTGDKLQGCEHQEQAL